MFFNFYLMRIMRKVNKNVGTLQDKLSKKNLDGFIFRSSNLSWYFKGRNFREAKKSPNFANKLSQMIHLEIFREN